MAGPDLPVSDRTIDVPRFARRVEQAARLHDPSSRLDRIEPVVGGASSLTYVASIATAGGPGRQVVLKVAPPGLPPTANRDVLRQARVLAALRGAAGVRVPSVVLLGQSSGPDDPPWFAMEHVSGDCLEPILDEAGSGLAPQEVTARAVAGAEMLGALHQVDPSMVGLGSEVPVPLDGEVERWTRVYRTVPEELCPGVGELHAGLLATVPPGMPPVVVHGDYRLGNMLASDGRIEAVIDWEIWTIGDPRLDVSWYLLNCDRASQHTAVRDAVGLPGVGDLLASYEQVAGLSLEQLGWFDALSRYKAGAIVAQILKHNRRRDVPDARVASWDPHVPVRFLADARRVLEARSRS